MDFRSATAKIVYESSDTMGGADSLKKAGADRAGAIRRRLHCDSAGSRARRCSRDDFAGLQLRLKTVRSAA